MRFDNVAVIGFGEAGPIFAKAFVDAGAARVSAYDILIDDPATEAAQRAKTEALGIEPAESSGQAVTGAALVLSTVTADQTVAAAERAAGSMAPGQIYLDLNSTSPRVKREAARAIEAAGASFIEGVAMDTVPNFGARVPLLIAGPGAQALAGELGEVGLNVECAGPELGQASSAKMLRSVLIKGFAALFAESMLAAGKLGLERRVVDSLAVTFPGLDWPAVVAHYLGRSAVHAKRQAAEMHASAETVEELGVEPIMARAIAARLDLAASLDLVSHYEVRENPEIDDYLRAVAAAERRSRK
jgi:3-hydroxyisobutyrate dehydrogenase-like beta-hydroxyacid dehydrogenase